jgi:hypothetical protein
MKRHDWKALFCAFLRFLGSLKASASSHISVVSNSYSESPAKTSLYKLRDQSNIGSVLIQSDLNASFTTRESFNVQVSNAFWKKSWNAIKAFSISDGNLREEKQSFRTVHSKVYRTISFISSIDIVHISKYCFHLPL